MRPMTAPTPCPRHHQNLESGPNYDDALFLMASPLLRKAGSNLSILWLSLTRLRRAIILNRRESVLMIGSASASQCGDPEWHRRKKRREERSLANTTAGRKSTPAKPA